MKTTQEIESGIFAIPLILPVSLEGQRQELEQSIMAAQKIMVDFARKHGWEEFVSNSFADQAEIFATQDDFLDRLKEMFGMEVDQQLPKTAVAGLENRILMAVSPAEYFRIFPQGDENMAFEKLLAHEIVHRLHVRILHGNEEAMGPIWFFEAFAIYGADQLANEKLSLDKIKETIAGIERGSYLKYSAVIRFLLKHYKLQDLVARAGNPDFSKELIEELK